LKLFDETEPEDEEWLSALDPGKQGLKLTSDATADTGRALSALDPGKQGLKLGADTAIDYQPVFQRLIQENKD